MTTVITRTVGVGKDYATPALAEADVEDIATSALGGTDLVANDGAIVFEIDAGTYGQLATNSSLTSDATRNVTYKAAAGSEHGGSLNKGVILTHTGNTLIPSDDFTVFEDLVVKTSHNYALVSGANGVIYRNLVMANTNSHVMILQKGTADAPVKLENCVAHATNGYGYYVFGTSTAAHVHLTNCTSLYSFSTYSLRNYGGAANLTLNNFLSINESGGTYQAVGSPSITGTNNIGGVTAALPEAQRAGAQTWTFTTDVSAASTGSQVIYNGTTGAMAYRDGNDAKEAGVGPSASATVPLTGIAGNARSGATTQPGAFAFPAFENFKLNTQQDPEIINEFFRNPFGYGPDSSEVKVTLPINCVPVFTICGDSTSLGQTSTEYWTAKELQPYVDRQGSDWPYVANDGSAFGYFWNKFLDTSGDDGVNFTKSAGLLTDITTSGDAFIPIHPRMGGKQLAGSFTYRIADGSPVNDYLSIASGAPIPDPLANTGAAYNGQPGSISPVWDFARTIKGLFVDSAGNEIAPYFIFLGATGPRFGTPGNPFGGSTLDWYNKRGLPLNEDIDLGYVHNQFRQTYIRPSVNYIVNELGKNPLHVGNLIMAGGADGNTIYPEEYQVSAGAAYLDYTNSIQSILNLSGDVSAATLPPTVMYLPYNAKPPGTDSFPADKTKLLQNSVKRVWADGIRNYVSLDSLFMDLVDGIHFRPISYALYGELFARAYTNMLTVRNYEIIAPTMAEIIY